MAINRKIRAIRPNEPPLDRLLTVNIRNYPDMAMVYEKFSKAIEKPLNRFILGNGAENVIKNVLLAIKPKIYVGTNQPGICWKYIARH